MLIIMNAEQVVENMVQAGATKAKLSIKNLLIRGKMDPEHFSALVLP